MPSLRVLVVDDSPTMRRMVRAALRGIPDVSFAEAGDGLAALEQLALQPIALMVLDLNMPQLHGIEVLGFMRRHEAYREIPVMVLSTRGDDASRSAAFAAGATAYLTKPFAPERLAAQARELLAGRDEVALRG